jgi:hypothetical protein
MSPELDRLVENDGLSWPRGDGPSWPHLGGDVSGC